MKRILFKYIAKRETKKGVICFIEIYLSSTLHILTEIHILCNLLDVKWLEEPCNWLYDTKNFRLLYENSFSDKEIDLKLSLNNQKRKKFAALNYSFLLSNFSISFSCSDRRFITEIVSWKIVYAGNKNIFWPENMYEMYI